MEENNIESLGVFSPKGIEGTGWISPYIRGYKNTLKIKEKLLDIFDKAKVVTVADVLCFVNDSIVVENEKMNSIGWLNKKSIEAAMIILTDPVQEKYVIYFSVTPTHLHSTPINEDQMVNHPPHYQSHSGLEAIDVIEAFTEKLNGKHAVCTANVIKYILRWKDKNGIQDLKKAQWYLNRLINHLEKETN